MNAHVQLPAPCDVPADSSAAVVDRSGSGDPALRVSGVSVALGGRRVLDGIDLCVEPGELVGLLGPNGAGKTTLLRATLGLIPVLSGQVEVGSSAGGRRRTVGYVPQRHEFAWDHPITVEQAVMTGRIARLGLWRRQRVSDWVAVHEALERVELVELRRRPVGELSGGQRQRVLVARALSVESSLLLLDEPFTGLDVPTQDLLSALFARLAEEGRAVVMTTHDLVAALATCARLVLLNRTVIADGTPAQLADPGVWQRTFGVRDDSPLLRMVGSI